MTSLLISATLVAQMTANTVTGTITQGVNCPMVAGDDGEAYALSSLPPALQTGDRVVLEMSEETPAFFGVCDQGRHVAWTRLTRPAANGMPERTWTNPEKPG